MIFKVGQLNKHIKSILKNNIDPILEVEGEVSNYKKASNGHFYFDLKDNEGLVNCVIWNSIAQENNINIQNGDKIEVKGKIDLYIKTGRFNINVYNAIKQGIGNIYEKFENLRKELESLGYFSDRYKKNVPDNCNIIGVVTSENGAAIQDIISVLSRRNPGITIYLYSSKVQGIDCHLDIAHGINILDEKADELGIQSILVSRGGGSIEDLWGYNEKFLVDTIFQCNTPIISGVGHEIDFTFCDFVADVRAITPSAAAERLTTPIETQIDRIKTYHHMLINLIDTKFGREKTLLENCKKLLKLKEPQGYIKDILEQFNLKNKNISDKIKKLIEFEKVKLDMIRTNIKEKSVKNILKKGFSLVQNSNGDIINSVKKFRENNGLTIIFYDGKIAL